MLANYLHIQPSLTLTAMEVMLRERQEKMVGGWEREQLCTNGIITGCILHMLRWGQPKMRPSNAILLLPIVVWAIVELSVAAPGWGQGHRVVGTSGKELPNSNWGGGRHERGRQPRTTVSMKGRREEGTAEPRPVEETLRRRAPSKLKLKWFWFLNLISLNQNRWIHMQYDISSS